MEDHHSMGHGNEAAAPKDAVDKGCGMFDFLKNKDHEEKPTEDMVMADAEKAQEVKKEDKPALMEKLQRSKSSSSSSSDEEGGEGVEKMKKKKEKKKKEEDGDQNKDACIPGEKCDATATDAGEKKGLMEKIKEKLPGQHKKAEEGAAAADVHSSDEEAKDKKGFLEKIKEKLPGSHKNEGDEKNTTLAKND